MQDKNHKICSRDKMLCTLYMRGCSEALGSTVVFFWQIEYCLVAVGFSHSYSFEFVKKVASQSRLDDTTKLERHTNSNHYFEASSLNLFKEGSHHQPKALVLIQGETYVPPILSHLM